MAGSPADIILDLIDESKPQGLPKGALKKARIQSAAKKVQPSDKSRVRNIRKLIDLSKCEYRRRFFRRESRR